MNADIKATIKWSATCLEYQQRKLQEKTIPYEVPCTTTEKVGGKIFCVRNTTPRHIIYYYSKFPILKKAADDLVKATKIVFLEFGVPKKNNFGIWTRQESYFRCGHKVQMRDIQIVLQAEEHRTSHSIILSQPQQ